MTFSFLSTFIFIWTFSFSFFSFTNSQIPLPDLYTFQSRTNYSNPLVGMVNISSIQFSYNHQIILGLFSNKNNSFCYMNGFNFNYFGWGYINSKNQTPSFISISPFSDVSSSRASYYSVGTQQGSIYQFYFIDDGLHFPYINSFSFDNQNTTQYSIKYMTYSYNNSFLAVVANNQIIILNWNKSIVSIRARQSFPYIHITSIDWYPNSTDILLVGGTGQVSGLFGLFIIKGDGQDNVVKTFNEKQTLAVKFTSNGKRVFQGVKDQITKIYDFINNNVQNPQPIPNSESSKQIITAADDAMFGLQSKNQVLAWKIIQKQQTFSINLTLNSTGTSFALSSNRNDILIIQNEEDIIISKWSLCSQNFFMNNGSCFDCTTFPSKCLNCFNSTYCLSCSSGFFINQSKQCQSCNSKFKYCEQCNVNSCTKCRNPFQLNESTCIGCQKLIPGCNYCQNLDDCQLCDQSTYNLNNVTKKCDCNDVSYRDQTDNKCKLCSIALIGCSKCLSATQCQICDIKQHFILNDTNKACYCQSHFWLNDIECNLCNSKIKYCDICSSDGSNCVSCIMPFGPFEDGKCISCQQSIIGCQQCKNMDQCKKCSSTQHFILNEDGQCQCNSTGHYIEFKDKCICNYTYFQKQSQCRLCNLSLIGCRTCVNQLNCTECNKYFNVTSFGNCVCMQNRYQNGSRCILCQQRIQYCKGCTYLQSSNQLTCNECNQGFSKNEQNKCYCPSGNQIVGSKCVEDNDQFVYIVVGCVFGVIVIVLAFTCIITKIRNRQSLYHLQQQGESEDNENESNLGKQLIVNQKDSGKNSSIQRKIDENRKRPISDSYFNYHNHNQINTTLSNNGENKSNNGNSLISSNVTQIVN